MSLSEPITCRTRGHIYQFSQVITAVYSHFVPFALISRIRFGLHGCLLVKRRIQVRLEVAKMCSAAQAYPFLVGGSPTDKGGSGGADLAEEPSPRNP
eukprot:8813616-Pyramimonas_sp.AAC.1